MNKQSIETARDADLRLSQHAMQRAARILVETLHEGGVVVGAGEVIHGGWARYRLKKGSKKSGMECSPSRY